MRSKLVGGWPILISILGAVTIVAGVGLIYPPAALMLLGGFLIAAALAEVYL